MSRLTQVSLAHRTVVLLLSVLVIAMGIYTGSALKQELIPNIELPRASILSVYTGAAPEAVEREVTKPIEDAVKGVSGVTDITSKSTSGISQISVTWEFGENSTEIQSDIRNAVDAARTRLPADVDPTVSAGSFNDFPVVIFAVSSDQPTEVLSQQLTDIAIPAIKTVDGVREVTVAGERQRHVVLTWKGKQAERLGVDINTVAQTFQANGIAIPAGTVQTGATNLDVQVGTSFNTIGQIQKLQLQGTDGPVSLEQVAEVKEQPVEQTSISRANGKSSLTLMVSKSEDGNTVTVAKGIRDVLPQIRAQLGNGAEFATVFDQAPFIEQSVHDLTVEGGLGLGMAVLVILLFLWSVRPTLITAISIPLSLLIALTGLWVGGYTLNILTLGALTVAIGRVVDDSIVVIENIKRHQALGRFGASSIVTAVKEVAGAVTSSTLTTVAVFLPIGLVGGQAGQMFRPFAVTVTVALLASLLVSLTVVPVLSSLFMGRPGPARAAREQARQAREAQRIAADTARDQATFNRKATALEARLTKRRVAPHRIAARLDTLRARHGLGGGAGLAAASERHAEHASSQTWLQRGYLPILRWALGHRLLTLLLAFAIFAGTLALAPRLKTDFIGEAGQTSLQIVQDLPQGSSLRQTDAAARKVEAVIAAEPSVQTYSTSVGGSGSLLSAGAQGSANHASHNITLAPKTNGNQVADRIRAAIAELSGVGVTEVFVGNQASDIVLYVETPDSKKLNTANRQVLDMLKAIPALSNIKSDLTVSKPMLKVDVNESKAADAGMTQAQIGMAAMRAIRGQNVGSLIRGDDSLDVVLRSRTPVKSTRELRGILLPVTQKQTMDARTKAADKVTARSEAFADRQKAEATRQFNKSLQTMRDNKAKAQKQLGTLRSTLRKLQTTLNTPIPPAPTPPPGVPIPPVPVDPYAAVRQQIAQVESGITAAQAQIKAIDTQYDAAIEQRNKSLDTQAEQQAIQDAGKEAQDVKARPLRLDQVAKVSEVAGPATISRVAGARTATVSALPTGSDLGSTTAAITAGLAKLDLPDGVTVRIGGVSQQQQDSFAQLGLAMLVAIAVVYLIMVATFGSLVQPLILLVSIPFAATGAIGLSLITDTPLGIPSMIGLLMLIGIVVTNAIVLIDLINQYRRDGAGIDDALMHGARLRLRPIVMTALATIMALVPMGLGVTGGGVFISKPLAIVVIGGLVSSTVLTLLLVPVLYDLIEKLRSGRNAGNRRTETEPGVGAAPGTADVGPGTGSGNS